MYVYDLCYSVVFICIHIMFSCAWLSRIATHSFTPVHVLSCEGHWKVTAVCEGVQREFTAVMLFICDGSTSYLGKVMIMMTMMMVAMMVMMMMVMVMVAMMVMTMMIYVSDDDDDGVDKNGPIDT